MAGVPRAGRHHLPGRAGVFSEGGAESQPGGATGTVESIGKSACMGNGFSSKIAGVGRNK
jgi:hypothetical protein